MTDATSPAKEGEWGWEPRIVAFCCNWCSYAGADLAGASRRQMPANVRVIRVMCSSRVDGGLITECFRRGADGVMVLGCHIGDCHYASGNVREEVRVGETRELLELLGIGKERLLLRWISASEGDLFASTVDEFTSAVKAMGPLRRDRDGA